MSDEPTLSEKERNQILHDLAIRAHDRHDAMLAERQKVAVESANVAIRALLLINGGAVVALLAFLGALESGDAEAVSLNQFVSALRYFAYGVGFSAVTAALAYLVNLLDADIQGLNEYHYEWPFVRAQKRHKILLTTRTVIHVCAILLSFASLTVFFLGVNQIANAVTNLGL